MRKSSLLFCCLLVLFGLSGCSTISSKIEQYTQSLTPTPTVPPSYKGDSVIGDTDILVTPIVTENHEKTVVFTKEKIDGLKANLERFSFINFVQTMSCGYKDENPVTVVSYTVQMSTESKVAQYSIVASANGESDKETTIHDYKNNITYVRDENESWIPAEGTVNILDIDLVNATSVYDIYQSIAGTVNLVEGVEGYVDRGIDIYQYTTKAKAKDLQGVSYDKLGNKIITIKGVGDSYFTPTYIGVEVEYIVGETTYYCKTVLEIYRIDDSQFLMPDLPNEEVAEE